MTTFNVVSMLVLLNTSLMHQIQHITPMSQIMNEISTK